MERDYIRSEKFGEVRSWKLEARRQKAEDRS
jgi:hypothetical protein